MDWHDSAEAGEVDLLALEGTEHTLPCRNYRRRVRLLCRYGGTRSAVVAEAWTGVAVSPFEGAEAHVEKIHHRKRTVSMEYDKGIVLHNDYFRFIQFALGLYEGNEFLSGEALAGFDWKAFYNFCERQTLTGIAFDGIAKLPKHVAPNKNLLMTWFCQSERIRKRNAVMNDATAHIYNSIKAEGFRCCILKGQGNALMYPDHAARTPGDVDVWVNAGRDDIRILAQQLAKGNGAVGKESLNHIELAVNGITVELHSTPAIISNPLYNHRLQKWLGRNADLQCGNVVSLPDGMGDIAMPTCAFNAVYQLFHLYHHYFYEGVGLRQIIDYYFNIERLSNGNIERRNDGGDINALQRELKYLGLWKFAGAVMYVLHEVLDLPEEKMIVKMDAKRGRLLLSEILSGGNFGQHDERYNFSHNAYGHNLQRLYRDWRLVRYYPAEALSEPLFRVWHFLWRLRIFRRT